jgi:mannose-1-phosphate guanylyltransferase
VNLHRHPETILAALEGEVPAGMSLATSFEPEILGTAGGLRAALALLDPSQPVLVLNADSLADADLPVLAAAHEAARAQHGAEATLLVRPRKEGEAYSPVHLDESGAIVGIGSTGGTGKVATFLGIHILGPEAIARIPRAGASDLVRHVYLPLLLEGRKLGACEHRGWWVEVGNPSLYLRANVSLLDEKAFVASLPPRAGTAVAHEGTSSFLGPGVEGEASARLARVVAGERCRFERGASVSGSVLGAAAQVGREARIEGSIVGPGVVVPDGARWRSRLVLLPAGGGPLRDEALP